MHIRRKELNISERLRPMYMAILSIVLGFALGAVFIQGSGLNALEAYSAMFLGAFSTPYKISEMLVKSSPFMLAALGFAIAFKAGYWNVGVEGQIVIGTIVALWGGITFKYLPSILLIPLIYLLGFIAAGAWSLFSGILKAKYGVNEILTTLMMNYAAFWVGHYLVHWPWDDAEVYVPQTIPIVSSAKLPILLEGTRLHVGIIIGVITGIVIYMFFKKSTLGYCIRAVGLSVEGARYGGVGVANTVIIASFLSGGIAGLGGVGEVLGAYHVILENLTYGYGFIGIAAAMLALNNPLGIIFSSFFFGFLYTGSLYMTRGAGLTIGAIQLFVGIMILVTLVSPLIEKITERKKPKPSISNESR